GDNLNLFAVMKLFQESETLEGFERSLNDENSRINNLDLNGDNYIDYIRVVDYVDGDVHTIVLQVALDRNNNQDVAVFTVQRFRNGSVQIQLIGDEVLYGNNYIIEPIFDETPNPGYIGRANRQNVTAIRTTPVQIAAWPVIRFIYLPNYVVWRSSWYWGYYPPYWSPWRPYYWHYYYGYHYNWHSHYYGHYRHWNHYRYARYNDYYYRNVRVFSPVVNVNIRSGNYKTTYSRPEQRRDGEALFAKTHPEQYKRSSEISTGNNTGRRSVSQSASERQSAGTSVSTTRRSTGTVTNKSGTNTSAGQNTGTERRSTTTVNQRTGTNPSAGQNTGTSRRSPATVTERAGSKPESGQKAETGRTSRQSTTGVRSTARRSSESKTTSKQKKSETAKEPEKSNSSRRK
ncbi:MAG TPA: hypothetical protein VMW32_09365, partial [Bacteroidales bacterium]|nr:hypothetical protein [Bacteroidales bacterium]